MFGFFKKKPEVPQEPHYDPLRIKVTDVRRGYLLDYDLKTWQATEEYEYDWGDNYFTYEFKLESGAEVRYLSVQEDGEEVTCWLMVPLRFSLLDASVEKAMLEHGKPPRNISYKGVEYYRDGEFPGYFRNIDDEEFAPFVEWTYFDEQNTRVLSISQWEEGEFEASIGEVIPDRAFSNILPAVD